MALSQKELTIRLEQIGKAFVDPDLNGWELDFLGKIQGKLLEFGAKAIISESEQYRLDQIMTKARVYRDPRGL